MTKKNTKSQKILISGSAGLVGSQAAEFYCKQGYQVIGLDNDMRAFFFGREASTLPNKKRLVEKYKNYKHFSVDIRNTKEVEKIFKKYGSQLDLIIHTAGQPSHDWAGSHPAIDFAVNAIGTHDILEATRKYNPQAVFIFTSTNKVYGDHPNQLPLVEQDKRWELPKNHQNFLGIDENVSIDNCLHSLMGASKVAADILVQEYGRYYGIKTGIFRGGCITGPAHFGAQLHGFLAYLVKAVNTGIPYTIFGYKGKQVRDNIHVYDLISAFHHFYKNPKMGAVYNMGGGRFSNISILEAIAKIEKILNKKAEIKYKSKNRIGDHIWYISNVSKFKSHYPGWNYKYNLDMILEELCFFAKKHDS
ncbi:MAG: NAD-dependent epimerase/dehydratase [Parcubacteria group bacterium GW2011_GWA1_36_12]|nr:MAG: NAD-dependent epimerase/dehydratase [Parcubacteria group bacterium GW2011_GWA1_36_12]